MCVCETERQRKREAEIEKEKATETHTQEGREHLLGWVGKASVRRGLGQASWDMNNEKETVI